MNFYQKLGSSNLIGCKLEVGMARDQAQSRPGKPRGRQKLRPPFLQLLKKLVLVQNKLFVGRNPVKNEQTCKGKNLLKNVVRCIRNATE